MNIPKSHEIYITEMQGNDAGTALFNEIAKGKTVKVNGNFLDIEKAISDLVDKHSFHYEREYMNNDDES